MKQIHFIDLSESDFVRFKMCVIDFYCFSFLAPTDNNIAICLPKMIFISAAKVSGSQKLNFPCFFKDLHQSSLVLCKLART